MDTGKETPEILATWIMAPDGTMLPSFYNHDYREHTTVDLVGKEHPEGIEEPKKLFTEEWDKWYEEAETVVKKSRYSMVDGGPSPYGRRGGVYTEMSVYSNDPFEVIRRFVCRGGRGKSGEEPLTWVPLFRMSDDWIVATLDYNKANDIASKYDKYYKMELEYRRERGIKIKD